MTLRFWIIDERVGGGGLGHPGLAGRAFFVEQPARGATDEAERMRRICSSPMSFVPALVGVAALVGAGCGSPEPDTYLLGAAPGEMAGQGGTLTPAAPLPPGGASAGAESVAASLAARPLPETPAERLAPHATCPVDMVGLETFCVDRFEAPNRAGALPLIMYTFVEAADWCAARAKRLCFDDEWTRACAGDPPTHYPYGNDHQPGRCNDTCLWLPFDQARLDGWPPAASSTEVRSLEELLDAAAASSAAGDVAQAHVLGLYQAQPSGSYPGCASTAGVIDLCGSVEEWTRRSDGGGGTGFSGSLKGRYWAEPRGCGSSVTSHGDYFRFYQIGFRCCADR